VDVALELEPDVAAVTVVAVVAAAVGASSVVDEFCSSLERTEIVMMKY
jgi:hypothetical protein